MKLQEIKTIAKGYFRNMKKENIIRHIQRSEGHDTCFAKLKSNECDNDNCFWRMECLSCSVAESLRVGSKRCSVRRVV